MTPTPNAAAVQRSTRTPIPDDGCTSCPAASVPATPAALGQEETTLPVDVPGTFREHLTREMPDEVEASAEAIHDLHGGPESRQWAAFRSCRTRAWFLRNRETGKLTVVSNSCRVRGCPFCSRSRGIQIARNLEPWMKTRRDPKHLVLTLRHSDRNLPDQIDHLYKAFQKLRRYRSWTRNVSGGLWFAQVTHNNKTSQWHPHLHVLLDAGFYPHAQLSRDWLKATQTSDNVYIRRIHDTLKAVRDASRYVARPGWLHTLSLDQRLQLLTAFSSRRLCGAFGTARKADLLTVQKLDPKLWERLGSFADVVHSAPNDPDAAAIVNAWARGHVLLQETTYEDFSDAIDAALSENARDPPPVLVPWVDSIWGPQGSPNKTMKQAV